MNSLSQPRRRAFTLVEMLVVLAIIALLVAILFPVFSRVREKGRQANCVSNLKQLGIGFAQYVQDNDEYYPMEAYNLNATGGTIVWPSLIYTYVKDQDVYKCPDDTLTADFGAVTFPVSYGYSTYFGLAHSMTNLGIHSEGLPCSFLVKPASTLFMADANGAAYVGDAPENWSELNTTTSPVELSDWNGIADLNQVNGGNFKSIVTGSYLSAPLARHSGMGNSVEYVWNNSSYYAVSDCFQPNIGCPGG